MAERLLSHALAAEAEPLKSLKVESAGVSACEGAHPSLNSVKVLKKVNIDLSDHKSKMLTQGLIDRSFAIFGMTSSHVNALQMHYIPNAPFIGRMRELMTDTAEKNIPDPIGGDIEDYEFCRDAMVEAIPTILEFLRKEFRE